MDQLFDSLSEDWISQPHSPRSDQARRSFSIASSPSQSSSASQSRIPRFKPQLSSRLSAEATKQRRGSSIPSAANAKRPLSERSSSKLNSLNSESGKTIADNKGSSSPKPPKPNIGQRPKSPASAPIQDTVQIKVSPKKETGNQGTPEWKRRLKSNSGSSEQQDLFSPLGLQNVFRPPPVDDRAEVRTGRRHQPAVTADTVSSGPRSSTLSRRIVATRIADNGGGARPGDEGSEAVAESGELGGDEIHEGVCSQQLAANLEGTLTGERPFRRPSQRSHDGSSNGTKGHRSRSPGARSTVSTPGSSPNSRTREKSVNAASILHSENTRITSGQTVISNEELSPCYVSRQDTIDGRIDYATIADAEKVRLRMQEVMQQRQERPNSLSSHIRISYAGQNSLPRSPQHYPNSELTSHSLPEDLSTGTMEFVANGGFINSRRGGRSQEGSFMRRPLSPSSRVSQNFGGSSASTTPRRRSTGSLQRPSTKSAGPEFSPVTPKRQRGRDHSSQERPTSSGSPLKLFDKHDTFTNDRLARRMSEFERTSGSVDLEKEQVSPRVRQTSRISSFGEGALDNHPFTSSRPLHSQQLPKDDENSTLPEREPGDFRFKHVPDRSLSSHSRRRRKRHPSLPLETHADARKPADRDVFRHEDWEPTAEVTISVTGKRLPYSPAKDPKPKRRRTLLEEELRLDTMVPSQHPEVAEASKKTILGRKRKDALYDSSIQVADPSVIASRQILRPRNPTPSQAGARGFYSGFTKSQIQTQESNKQRHETPAMAIDAPTEKLAEELAGLALNVAQDMSGSIRKPSVTTADFFNEAQQIMQLIRAKGRAPSSHIDEEEVTPTSDDDTYDTKLLDSTRDEFSRPPSREGGSLRKVHEPVQLDARIVSQLRRFRDTDDVGITLSSSLKSLQVAQPTGALSYAAVQEAVRHAGDEVESDVDIRILSAKAGSQQHLSTTEALNTDVSLQMHSVGSQGTSGPSTGRSIPTDSSRGSKNRAVIAPETVAHLLSDQVAGMTFDHERQVWVKSRNTSKTEKASENEQASTDVTEDDLLGAIPDLSVDEIEELQRVKTAGSLLKNGTLAVDHISETVPNKSEDQSEAPDHASDTVSSRPQTAEGQKMNLHDDSSAPSKYSRFTSSGPIDETRATSWGGGAIRQKTTEAGGQDHAGLQSLTQEDAEEVEHEISILEGRVAQTPKLQNYRQPRVVTVAFSSPLVDQIDVPMPDEGSSIWDDADALNLDDSPVRNSNDTGLSRSTRRTPNRFGRKHSYRDRSRRASIGHQSYVARPMSRLDEHEELSLIHCPSGSDLDKVISTPQHKNSSVIPVPLTSGQVSNASFQLSPLPDFTVHEIDRPLDRVQLARGPDTHHFWQVGQRISLSTQDIVSKLTDVEPYEPYWEHLRRMDLRNKGMVTLHMLSGFCVRLEELDVSNNELREINDAPSSLRCLRIRHNTLSSLTAWGHLRNLQYLDVSGNQLTDLRGFQTLVHLRELKADDNQIRSLEGLLKLDGLLRLRLRRNRISRAEFKDSMLYVMSSEINVRTALTGYQQAPNLSRPLQ